MNRRAGPITVVVYISAAACSGGGAETQTGLPDQPPRYEFTVDGWPGSAEQAALLDAEARDAEWAVSMEQVLTDGLRGLDDVDYELLRTECRTTVCGIAIDYAIFDPLGEKYTDTRQIRERLIGAVRESTERIGIDGLGYDFAAAYGVDGKWTGTVGITVRRMTPTNVELFLAPLSPAGATEARR